MSGNSSRKPVGLFLRDSCDVQALIDHITLKAQDADFVSKLHAAADKARQQPLRGRPLKTNNDTAHKHSGGDENMIAPPTILRRLITGPASRLPIGVGAVAARLTQTYR